MEGVEGCCSPLARCYCRPTVCIVLLPLPYRGAPCAGDVVAVRTYGAQVKATQGHLCFALARRTRKHDI